MRIIEVTDIHGHKHQVDADALDAKRFAKDGEKHSFTMMAMDTAGVLFIAKGDNNMDYKVTDEMQKRVDDAYNEMCRDLSSAWRGKDNPPPAAVPNDTPEKAYGEMREAIQHAWKRGAR